MSQKSTTSSLDAEFMQRAAGITLAEFSAALSSGVLRAIDSRKFPDRDADGLIDWRPWIWAGWIIGDGPIGPNGPLGPGGPFGPGGQPGN